MWRGLAFTLILITTTIGFLSCSVSDSEYIKTAAKEAQKTTWEISQFFHRWNIGLSQSKLKAKVYLPAGGTVRTTLGSLSKFTAAAAGICGSLGAVFAIVMIFLPPTSPELQLIRQNYNVMNERLDSISSSIDNIKSLLKTEAQKAMYIEHENAIKTGNEKLNEFIEKISQITCEIEYQCLRGLTSIAEQYESYFDVERNVNSIVRGATENGVFGEETLLDLYKTSSKCDLPKITQFVSGIGVLIFRGMVLVSTRGRITSAHYDSSIHSNYLTSALAKLEQKRQEIEKSCLGDIDLYIKRDLDELKPKLTPDTRQTNEALLQFLTAKYTWMRWYITSYVSDSGPELWAKSSAFDGFYIRSEQHQVNAIAWPIIHGPVSVKQFKVNAVRDIFTEAGTDINEIVQNIPKNLYLENQINSILSMKSAREHVMSYYDIHATSKHIYTTKINENPFLFDGGQSKYLLVYFNQSEILTCTKNCYDNGKCLIYPHSNQTFCRCNRHYYGEYCNITRTLSQLQLDAGNLISKTLVLPSIPSLKFSLEDSRRSMLLSFEDITEAFTKLNNMISKQFNDLRKFITQQSQWHDTIMLYKEALQNIRYLASFYRDYIDFNHWNLTVLPTVLAVVPVKKTGCQSPSEGIELLDPLKLQKWINDVNYLIVGRYNDVFLGHKPLLFMLMDQYKDRLCYPDYKAKINSAYHQLITLQLQGFLMWNMVLVFFNKNSSTVLERYDELIAEQSKALQNMTCTVDIMNSMNLRHCDGMYIHNNMDVKIECREGFYPKEQKRLWVKEVAGYSSQYSINRGSADQIIGFVNVYSGYSYGGLAWTQAPAQRSNPQYIIVKFEESVFPEEIRIYEVYNAGAVTRIGVKFYNNRFRTIWATSEAKVIKHSREFSPYFKPLPFLVHEVKIELDPSKADDYVAIDAVMIIGKPLRNDERFRWYEAYRWVSLSTQPSSITINLHEPLYIKNVTLYGASSSTVVGIQAYYPPGFWETISRNERMTNEEGSWYFTPELRFLDKKANKIRVIWYVKQGPHVHPLTPISIVGLQRLQDTCAKMNASACVRCECDSEGSSSSICDVNGQCQCKLNYYGKRCASRNCSVGQWSSWTDCPCGERNKTQSRSRNITIAIYGNGKRCPSLNEKRDCPYKDCSCTSGFYGPTCKNRNCRVSQWSIWSRVCTTECFDNGEQVRRRSILVRKEGSGQNCGPLEDKNVCPYIRCRNVCRASGGCTLQRV